MQSLLHSWWNVKKYPVYIHAHNHSFVRKLIQTVQLNQVQLTIHLWQIMPNSSRLVVLRFKLTTFCTRGQCLNHRPTTSLFSWWSRRSHSFYFSLCIFALHNKTWFYWAKFCYITFIYFLLLVSLYKCTHNAQNSKVNKNHIITFFYFSYL